MMQMSGGCSLLAFTECLSSAQAQRCPSWAFLSSPSSHLVLEEEGGGPDWPSHCRSRPRPARSLNPHSFERPGFSPGSQGSSVFVFN